MSHFACAVVAETLLALSMNKANRGRMVQDGALKCLLSVGQSMDKKDEENCKLCLC